MAVDMDWENLGFGYVKTPYRFVAEYKNGKWNKGRLTTYDKIVIPESAGVLQYAQTAFEGLKAYTAKDGSIVTFRPDLNAERMAQSAARLEMPALPEGMFLKAVEQVVAANKDFVPPYGSGASLYLRPYIFGTSNVIGVKPCETYQFRLFASPVGPYFKNGVKPLSIRVSDFDRAAPHGTGHIKAGLNYAMSLHAIVDAHNCGFDENMYLDAATRTFVEETGGANFIFVTKDGTIVTPKSDSILPSITRRSLCYVAENYLNMRVEHRPVTFEEIKDFAECGLCGTAAVISPVGRIYDHGEEILFPSGMEEMGPVIKQLYDTLTGIQYGETEAPEGWIRAIDPDAVFEEQEEETVYEEETAEDDGETQETENTEVIQETETVEEAETVEEDGEPEEEEITEETEGDELSEETEESENEEIAAEEETEETEEIEEQGDNESDDDADA